MVFDIFQFFSDHVSQVIKSTRVHVRDLYRIRPLLDLKTSVLLANALVSSILDNCKSLFLSLTDFVLRRLHLVQNSLCRVVFIYLFIYLFFCVAFNSQGHIAMGSLQVEETSAYCTVNHRASASNYQLSNMKRLARDSNWRPQRSEARTLTATYTTELQGCHLFL